MHGSFVPVPVENPGGLVTRLDPVDVPLGKSWDCQNVDFGPGFVESRAGTTLMGTFSGGILSMKEFVLLNPATRRFLIVTGTGVLYRENGGTPGFTSTSVVESYLGLASRMRSVTMYGREWMGFSADGKIGSEDPRHYDDVNLDRVSVAPPGRAVASALDNAAAGSIVKGRRGVRVAFLSRSGALSALSPEFTWNAAGGKKCDVMDIPTGPPNIVARLVCFTQANDERYFFIPGSAMEIKDNTSVNISALDFTDEDLGNGLNVDDLFRLVELPAVAGFEKFSNRIVGWGARNELMRIGDEGFLGLSFNGGFTVNTPNGWTGQIGGYSKSNPAGATGDCLRITGDGVSQRGRLENNFPASVGLTPGIGYSARVRIKKSSAIMTGTVHVYVVSAASASFGVHAMSIDASEVSDTAWTTIEKEFLTAVNNVTGADWKLRISGGGPPGGGGIPISNGDYFDIDFVKPYPSHLPISPSDLWFSLPGEPEAFNPLRCRVSVSENDGQQVRCVFRLRNNLYAVKERSTHMTADNGRDPVEWQVEEVSAEVGTLSPDGVDTADGWAVIAARAGPYFFSGGVPFPFGSDIQPTWDRINWLHGEKIRVRIDTEKKRILFTVPLDAATEPSHLLVCRYFGSSPLEQQEWVPWPIAVNAIAFSERSDGTRLTLFGTAAAKVLKLDPATPNDESSAIDSRYALAYIGEESGRNLYGALTMNAEGAGALELLAFYPNRTEAVTLPTVTLETPAKKDIEFPVIRVKTERASFRVRSNAVGAKWRLKKFVAYLKRAPHTPHRGLRQAG